MRAKTIKKKNDNLNKRKNGFKSTNDVPNQVKLLSGSQKLRVLRQREVSRKNVWPDDDERVAYRSNNRVLRLRNSSFHSTPFVFNTYCCPFRAVPRAVTVLRSIFFISFTPLPGRPLHHQGACSAARPSPGELYSIKRHDLFSDGHFLLRRDTMQPFDQH
mgnify:CR=1 FL=1